MKIPLLILILFLFCGCNEQSLEVFKIKEVIDGDTIYLANGDMVDLMGINSPEISSNEDVDVFIRETGFTKEEVQRLSIFAKKLMEEYLKDHKLDQVLIVYDKHEKNRKGKISAYVYVDLGFPTSRKFSNESPFLGEMLIKYNGTYWIMLNAAMIQSGLAIPNTIQSTTRFSKLFEKIYLETGKERLLNTFRDEKKLLDMPSNSGSIKP